MNVIKLLKNGGMFLLMVGLLDGCRSDPAPVLSIICLGDGFGGGDCSFPNGDRKYLPPSELKNFWMTSQPDFYNFSAWCFDTTPKKVSSIIQSTTGLGSGEAVVVAPPEN